MPTPKKGARLGGSPAHQRLILRNLATALFEHGRVTTTEAKARTLRPYAEKLITKAKKGDLNSRRQVVAELFKSPDWKLLEETGEFQVNKYPQHRLFTEIAEMFADRPGGYTRITKIGPRKGDNAPMAVIELVQESYTPSAPKAKKEQAAAPAPVEEKVEEPVEETEAVEAVAVETEAADTETEAPRGLADVEFNDDVVKAEEDGSGPEGFEIKGNADSGKYHTPASQWYDQTIAEVWFRTEEAAEAAGFTKAG